jgi:hypothetical protein
MYEITIFPNTIAPWFTQVFAGIFELQKDGKAAVSIASQIEHTELIDSLALLLEVRESRSGRRRTILIDLNDNTRFSVPEAVSWYDRIVKRSFSSPYIGKLPVDIQGKVAPYGINFNCGSPSVPVLRLFSAHHLMRVQAVGKPKAGKQRLWWQHELRFLLYLLGRSNLSLYERDFEGSPNDSTKHGIFFLTRLFESNGSADGLTTFSRERIELVKALKKGFGRRFHGGIVKNRISERYCDKELLFPKVSRRQFTRILREADIAVCTLGVGKSTPWKLGEAIAAARCIVSEPLFFELPAPLEESIHIRTYRTIEDCLKMCEELIRDRKTMRQMKEQAWCYYHLHVKADRLMERILREAFSN